MPEPPRHLGGLVARGARGVGAPLQGPDPSAGKHLPARTLALASRRD